MTVMVPVTEEVAEERVSQYTLADAILDGARLVDRQARRRWVTADCQAACAMGAAWIAVGKPGL